MFCKLCGKELKEDEVCTCNENSGALKANLLEEKEVNRGKRVSPWIWLCGAVGILISIVFVIIFATAPKKIELADYLNDSPTISGYDGNGSISLDELFDYSTFEKDLLVIASEENGTELDDELASYVLGGYGVLSDVEQALSDISMIVWKNDSKVNELVELSNGDSIVVEVISKQPENKAFNRKFVKGKTAFTVKGLSEVERVDIFANVSVHFDGISGDATVSINRESATEIIQACDFSVDKAYGVSNGDVVIVSIDNIDALAEEYNIIPTETSKEFQVEGLDSYITSPEQISMEMIKQFVDRFVAEQSKEVVDVGTLLTYGEIKYYGTFLVMPKEDASFVKENELHIFIHYDKYVDGEFSETIYLPLSFSNITISSDGNMNVAFEDGSAPVFFVDMTAFEKKYEDSYDIYKLD